ncbi:NADPH-dependent F420 reductase [Nigerium massiliense]|uniref:NADPH-dependent F420 reductase n=1 Tax=Nigerium massiliense TaxID=1522317 RepID=UPI00058E48FC|nr:NAD(P)-binding domain-containing protein [Nigerium massiliense]
MSDLAILGAGKLGTTVARLARSQGLAVDVARSGDPASIRLIVEVLAPGARAVAPPEAIAGAEMVMLALPLSKYPSLDADALAGKLVIDAMNYWWEVDGRDTELAHAEPSSSEVVGSFLAGSTLVKAFNHIGYHDLADQARPVGTPGRVAMALAGDDAAARHRVAELVDRLGFDPVELPTLHAGKALEPGHPAFGAALPADELDVLLR